MYELDRDDPFSNMCDDILTYEKIGKVLVVGHFNTRVVTYQNAAIDDNVMVSYFTRDSKDYIMSEYGRLSLLQISVCM